MEIKSESYQSFIARNQLTFNAVKVPGRTDGMMNDGKMTHYLCTLSQIGKGPVKSFSFFYSMGSAHKTGPKLADTLDSLASDAAGSDQSFDEWCGELGYDSDSRKAEEIYKACQNSAAKLLALLGRIEFNNLLNNVERL